jgi:uncharacterized YkwD family protein
LKRILIIATLVFSLLTVGVFAQTYNCKSGDTLSKIAQKYNTTISRLKACNPQLKDSSSLKPGQKLTLPDQGSISDYEKEVARLVNVERSKAGLMKLTLNAQISKVARIKCQDMINKKYFSHISPTYGSPFKMMESYGIRFSAAGENIAYGQKTPAEVMRGWMNSPGHRSNILSRTYTNIGVGCAKSKTGVNYWTQMFTKPTK